MTAMALILATVLFVCIFVQHGGFATTPQTPSEQTEIHNLKQTIESLGRQLITQQLFVEERVRTDGDSGIKTITLRHEGSHPYFAESYTGKFPGDIRDGSWSQILSAGPLNAVMNGVDFKTGALYYKLRQPSTTNKNYNVLEDIPFPDVPPKVKSKPTVMEQIAEMKQYFKAFKNQDRHIRPDYEHYFKPVLCYLEGGWIRDTTSNDAHTHLNHFTAWYNQMQRARYSINSGDHAHFVELHPTKIIDIKDGIPVYGRWDYRVACHPIKYHLRRSDLILIDDLTNRIRTFKTYGQFAMRPEARFRISGTRGKNYNKNTGVGQESDRGYGMEILDHIMQEIPGKDNYKGYLNDDSFGMYHDNLEYRNYTRLNTAYYHRMYKVETKDAMGVSIVHRGFSDVNLWTAQTTNPHIIEMKAPYCRYNKTVHKKICTDVSTRYTYALPLEIIWMSPLLSWNPFDINFFDGNWRQSPAKAVYANGRNGGYSKVRAYNGTNDHSFFLTPYEFLHRGVVGNNTNHGIGVLDKKGVLRSVIGSGPRIFINIPDVGNIRMRYPIMPLHDEGNTVFKELDALKSMAMDMSGYARYFEKDPSKTIAAKLPDLPRNEHFKMATTHKDPPGMHSHDVEITPEQMLALSKNLTATAFTTLNNGHQHQIDIKKNSDGHYVITSCDGQVDCWDGHGHRLYHQTS